MTITAIVHVSFSECINFFFPCNSWSAGSTFENLAEIEVFSSPYPLGNNFKLYVDFIEEFLGDEWRIGSFIPIATFLWIFKFSVVEGWFKHSINHTQSETFSVFGSKSLGMSKFPYLSTTKSFVSYPFKHLFYERGSFGIDLNVAFLILRSSTYDIISYWHHSRSHTEFAFSSEPSSHILGSVIILKFCLATENHQKKFLVWVISEGSSMGSDLY